MGEFVESVGNRATPRVAHLHIAEGREDAQQVAREVRIGRGACLGRKMNSAAAPGTVDVSGIGSLLNLEKAAYIGGKAGGSGGDATLTVDGSTEGVGDAAPVVKIGGALVLNSGGTLNLNNGVIEGSSPSALLDLDGGTFEPTPVADQIDDQHSVLQDVTIGQPNSIDQDLSIDSTVLTLVPGITAG